MKSQNPIFKIFLNGQTHRLTHKQKPVCPHFFNGAYLVEINEVFMLKSSKLQKLYILLINVELGMKKAL